MAFPHEVPALLRDLKQALNLHCPFPVHPSWQTLPNNGVGIVAPTGLGSVSLFSC